MGSDRGAVGVSTGRKLKSSLLLFAVATVAYAVKSKSTHGRFLGVPFEWRIPSINEIRVTLWNPASDRLFVPTIFGIGWILNTHELLKRLGCIETKSQSTQTVKDTEE